MRNPAIHIKILTGAIFLAGSLALAPTFAADKTPAEEGKDIAENRAKGNCFSCHEYAGAVLPGNVGPKLLNMKARYPDKEKLKAQIWDPAKSNPMTIMPPFGRHRILTEKEIDAVVEWVHTL